MPKEVKELMAEEEVKVEDIAEVIEEENLEELGVEEIDITETEEAVEEASDSESEAAEEESVEGAEEESESEEDEVEEVREDADDEDEVEEAELSFDAVLEELMALRTENAELKEQVNALKKSNKRLDKKLKGEYTAKAEFLAKTANLTAELFPNEGEAEKEAEAEAKKLAEVRKYYKGDGIAD